MSGPIPKSAPENVNTESQSEKTQQPSGEMKGRTFTPTPNKWDESTKIMYYLATAFAVTCLFVGVVGLLVYLGQLQLGWLNVGTLTQAHGLYTMLSGFVAAAITGIVVFTTYCAHLSRDNNNVQYPIN